MVPQLIQYWHSGDPPRPIVELIASFPPHNPGLRQVLFDEASAASFIAEHLSSREAAAFRACAQPTSQADYLRYCAGYVMGGICLDIDVRCIGDIRSLLDDHETGLVFGQRDPLPHPIPGLPPWPHSVGPYETLINGIFAFRDPGAPLLALALEVATANIEARIADGPLGVWLTTGPGVFTSFYLLRQLGSMDAFLDYAAGTVLVPSLKVFREVVGDGTRVDSAMEGVETAAVEDLADRLEHVGLPAEARRESHWSRRGANLFRESP